MEPLTQLDGKEPSNSMRVALGYTCYYCMFLKVNFSSCSHVIQFLENNVDGIRNMDLS